MRSAHRTLIYSYLQADLLRVVIMVVQTTWAPHLTPRKDFAVQEGHVPCQWQRRAMKERRNDEEIVYRLATIHLSSQGGMPPVINRLKSPSVRPCLRCFKEGISFFASCRSPRPQGATADH